MRVADAFYQLQMGAPEAAEKTCLSLLKRERGNVEATLLMAQIYGQGGRVADCITMLTRAQRLRSQDPTIAYNLGVALNMAHRHEEAAAAYRRVLALAPTHIDARTNLAACLMCLGLPEKASCELKLLRSVDPTSRTIFLNYLSALLESGDCIAALAEIEAAPKALGGDPQAKLLLGRALNGARRHQEAAVLFEELLTRAPPSVDVLNGWGVALLGLGETKQALDRLREAVMRDPTLAEAHHNLGHALHRSGLFDEALQSYDRARELASFVPALAYNKSMLLLALGQFEDGWANFESRKLLGSQALGVNLTQIRDLQNIAQAKGASVLIDWEQGLGDTIQFCRFARSLADIGAKVTLRVQPCMQTVLRSLDKRVKVTSGDIDPRDHKLHVQLMSLPGLFQTNEDNIPFRDGYLSLDAARVDEWRARIGTQGFRIGIAWQGNKQAKVDLGRSFSLECFRPLAGIPGVRLISLQKNEGSEEVTQFGAELGLETLGPGFDAGDQAFLDSAAVMQSLDLVITSDTALAHLAGATGRPVWVALQHVPDWRWMLDRAESPWYSSMRLFRQGTPGDWAGVFEAMSACLAQERR